jgi:hypothetical protein
MKAVLALTGALCALGLTLTSRGAEALCGANASG